MDKIRKYTIFKDCFIMKLYSIQHLDYRYNGNRVIKNKFLNTEYNVLTFKSNNSVINWEVKFGEKAKSYFKKDVVSVTVENSKNTFHLKDYFRIDQKFDCSNLFSIDTNCTEKEFKEFLNKLVNFLNLEINKEPLHDILLGKVWRHYPADLSSYK